MISEDNLSETPQTVFDADFEGLTSNAELYIFNMKTVRIGLGLFRLRLGICKGICCVK